MMQTVSAENDRTKKDTTSNTQMMGGYIRDRDEASKVLEDASYA